MLDSAVRGLIRRGLRTTNRDIRHVDIVKYRNARGIVRSIYEDMEREAGFLCPPVVLHSPSPEVMAAAWSLLRGTLLAPGTVSRPKKEAVAAAVSRSNQCPYCVAVHEAAQEIFTGADPADLGDLERWVSGDAEHAPSHGCDELRDVVFAFNYINRMVSVFLPESPVPIPAPAGLRAPALGLLGRINLLPRQVDSVETGEVDLIDGVSERLDRATRASVPPLLCSLIEHHLSTFEPSGPADDPAPAAVLQRLAPGDRALGRFALLTALAPWRVDDATVAAARSSRSDRVLIDTAARAALEAARHAIKRVSC